MTSPHRYARGPDEPPKLIAHRGLSSRAPENTLAAVRLALTAGIPIIEVDVHLTSDDEVVAIHDRTLQRTTTGNGAVRSYLLEEIRQFDAGSWFDPTFARERIPTLHEVLECVGTDALLNVEMKHYPFHPIPVSHVARCVVDCVRSHQAIGRVLFTSFEAGLLHEVRTLEPGASVGLLHDWMRGLFRSPFELARSVGSGLFICGRHELRTSMLARAKELGMAVYVYTINDPGDAQRFSSLGVDGLISDVPDVLAKMVASFR